MNNLSDIDLIVKIIIGVIGVIATLGKLRDFFANSKLKQELKTDIEILEKIKNTNLYNLDLEEKIKRNITKAYKNRNDGFTNFLYGISLFVGFGFWTINLLGNITQDFNGWSILTLSVSFIGLSIAFGVDEKENNSEENTPFLTIGFFEKTNFKFAVITLLLTIIITPILIWKINNFSWWIFLSVIFLIMSILKLVKIVRKIN